MRIADMGKANLKRLCGRDNRVKSEVFVLNAGSS